MNRHFIISAVLLVLFTSCSILDCETSESYYPTRQAAVDDGAFKRGWIPEYLPQSMYEIHEMHDIENNESWMTFKFNLYDLTLLGKKCKTVKEDDVALPRARSKRIPWWPKDLIDNSRVKIPNTKSYIFYDCTAVSYLNKSQSKNDPLFFAAETDLTDTNSSRAWCWRRPF